MKLICKYFSLSQRGITSHKFGVQVAGFKLHMIGILQLEACKPKSSLSFGIYRASGIVEGLVEISFQESNPAYVRPNTSRH
jgi:hypothetical protein